MHTNVFGFTQAQLPAGPPLPVEMEPGYFKAQFRAESTCQKIFRIAKQIFLGLGIFWLLAHLCKSLAYRAFNSMVPRHRDEVPMDLYKEYGRLFRVQRQTVETPDGIKLDATVFASRDPRPNLPTLILFENMDGSYTDGIHPLLELAHEKQAAVNIVLFNYRGRGLSSGPFSIDSDLVIDGLSIVEFVEKKLKTAPDQIHFYGHSIGGAVSAITQAVHAERLTGVHVSDRTFTNMPDVIRKVKIDQIFRIPRCLGSFASWTASYFARLTSIELDAHDAFSRLKGKKFTLLLENDEVIPKDARLGEKVSSDLVIRLPENGDHTSSITRFGDEVRDFLI